MVEDTRERNGWIKARIGCYWSRGPYHVATIHCGSNRGYVVYRDHQRIAEFVPWARVEKITADSCPIKVR